MNPAEGCDEFAVTVLFYCALAGTVTSAIYCGMVLAGALRFARRKRREERAAVDYLPPVSVLKPLHGAEPDLEENLRGFFALDYPEYELLFCARHADDAGLQMARRIAAQHPAVRARFLTCGEPRFPNAKMWSMAALAQAASYEALVTSGGMRACRRIICGAWRRSWPIQSGSWRRACMWGGRRAGWRRNWTRWARA